VEAVLPLLGQDPLTGVEVALTLPRRRLCVHCYSVHLSSPAAGHHHVCARCRDGTVRCLRTVYSVTTRRLGNRRAYRGVSLPASCVSGRPYFLTLARPAQQPAFKAVVGLKTREGPSATGTWQGQLRCHHGGGTWQHRTPPWGRGSGPPRPVGAVRPVEVWSPHVAALNLPGESGSAGATREPPCLHGHVEAPVL
jgi:hypothetical protein